MKIKKSILSGWPNKWLFLLLVCGVCLGQDISSSHRKKLRSEFSMATLKAYQQNADGKIRDFYNYLNLLSDTTDAELKEQLKQSVYGLFESRDVILENFLTDQNDRIPLSYLLENVFGRKMKFALITVEPRQDFSSDSWTGTYTLQISSAETTKTARISQTVFLKSKPKQFGESVKNVWIVSLGAMSESN